MMPHHSIVFVIPSLQQGGAERVISRLSLYLSRFVKVVIVTWDGSIRSFDFGGEIIDCNLPAKGGVIAKIAQQRRRVSALRRILQERKPQQVIGFMEAANVPVILASRKLAFNCHVTVSLRTAPCRIRGIPRLLGRMLYPNADRIVVQSQQGLEELLCEWGLPSDRCVVIPNPVDSLYFRDPSVGGVVRDGGLVLAVGRLVPVKGYDILLAAWASHLRDLPVQLSIFGEGPWRQELQLQINRLGLRDCVVIHGATSNLRAEFDRCSAFVLSSINEGFPNALAEAMACGCPVVSTDCPTGPREMIKDGVNGLLVPVGDVQALGIALRRLLLDPEYAKRLGVAARSTAAAWAIERLAPQWLTSERLA